MQRPKNYLTRSLFLVRAELALEVAPIYFKYGSCLFYKAQDEADILGDQGQSAASKRDTGNDAVRRRRCSVIPC